MSNPYIGIIEMFELENRKSSNENRKIKIGIIEAEIRIEATQLTRRIVTALPQIRPMSFVKASLGISNTIEDNSNVIMPYYQGARLETYKNDPW